MPLLYLAKVNLNSNIYDIYENKLDLKMVFDIIYKNILAKTVYSVKSNEKYNDSYGNPINYIRESRYTFREIEKNTDKIITGKLVRSFNKPTEKLDISSNKMVTTYVEENASIYFYYDICNEMIAFCERQSFGYNQFINAFSYLLNKCVNKYEFEIFLQKDKNILEEKMNTFKTVKKIKATLIPPNSNEDDLQELRKELEYMQQCQDANATKMNLEFVSENMKMESKVMKDIITAVSHGYGDVTATGVNKYGRSQTICSSHDAAFTTNIQENISKEDYNEEARFLIQRFLSKLVNKVIH